MRRVPRERESKRCEFGYDRHARLGVVPLKLIHRPRLVHPYIVVLDGVIQEGSFGEVANEALEVDVDAVEFGVDVRGGVDSGASLGFLLLEQDEPLAAVSLRDGVGAKFREREARVALQHGELLRHVRGCPGRGDLGGGFLHRLGRRDRRLLSLRRDVRGGLLHRGPQLAEVHGR